MLTDDGVKVVVVEAALLIEAKWTPLADEVWVVTAPQEQVLSRLTGRGMSHEQALARIESQMPQDERVTHADVVIANASGIYELESSIANAFPKLHYRGVPSHRRAVLRAPGR